MVEFYKDTKIIATYHPSSILKKYDFHVIAELDIAKAKKESKSKKHIIPTIDFCLKPNITQVIEWLDEIQDGDRISFDLETLTHDIRCLGIARNDNNNLVKKAIVIPFIEFPSSTMVTPGSSTLITVESHSKVMESYWSAEQDVMILKKLSEVFDNPEIQVVGQNSINFDQPLVEGQLGIHIANHYMDTMHAHHCCYLEFKKGLNFLTSIYTDYQNYWSDKVTADDMSEWKYCAMDCVVTLDASYKIDSELRSGTKQEKIYFDHMHKMCVALSRAQQLGILIDVELKTKMSADALVELAVIQKRINITASSITNKEENINVNSPKQIKKLVYEDLGFPVQKNKDKKPTVDEVAMKNLLTRYPDETILKDIVSYRKLRTLRSTFLEASLDPDGYMRTNWNGSGTKNGRISSSKNKITDRGQNMQNIPKKIRNLYISETGWSVVRGDLAQAETMVVADILYRCGDTTLRKKYLEDPNFDIHTWMMDMINHYTQGKVEADRQMGKLANHSGNYMAGPGVMVAKAMKFDIPGVNYYVAKKILEARHKAIPGLKVWWKEVENNLKKNRTLTTCMGRTRQFFGRLDNTTLRDAVAFEPQSIVGDVNNKIFWQMCYYFRGTPAKVVIQVHDEVGTICPDNMVEEVIAAHRRFSLIPLEIIRNKPLIIPVDMEVGKNWKDCESVD
jgi:DNA polymerase I-like protein with 3'-5' exonuclease and polymerase domains